jgi:hypothetical protein
LNTKYKAWKNSKTTISVDEEETIELPPGIYKVISITNSTKDSEDESNNLEEMIFRGR